MPPVPTDTRAADRRYRDAALDALAAWPIRAEQVEIVCVSENVTYRVRTGEGDFVLRLHRPGYHTRKELVSERVWTEALRAAGIAAPEGVRAHDGEYYLAQAIDRSEHRWAGLTRWIEGEPLERLLPGLDDGALEAAFGRLGHLAAELHNQSSAWRPPPGFTRHAFDIDGYFGATPFWGRFWECPALSRSERRLLSHTVREVRTALARLDKSAAHYGMIHADLHFGNVLRRTGQTPLVPIDFDDAGFGWHHYELAVALAEFRADSRYEAFKAALLHGYRQLRPFNDAAAALIDTFVLIRFMVILGWLDARPEFASQPRLTRHKALLCQLCAEYRPP